MTLRFLRAIALSLQFEGERYTNDPDDRGGATKYGLTWRFLRSRIGAGATHPKDLSLEAALGVYWQCIWRPQRFEEYPDADVALKVFDMSLPMGETQAVKYVQRVLGELLQKSVTVDGIIGPQTLSALSLISTRNLPIIPALIRTSIGHYEGIVSRSPSQRKWLNGWLRRAAYDPRKLHV